MSQSAPVTQYLTRLSKSLDLNNATPEYARISSFEAPQVPVRCTKYSANGQYMAYAVQDYVKIVDAASGADVATLDVQTVNDLDFSPLGKFLVTWEIPKKDPEVQDKVFPNMKVWSSATGELIHSYMCKLQSGWNLQFTHDEKYFGRLIKDEVVFYETSNLKTVWSKLRVENCSSFALSPGQNYSVAVFIAQKGSKPAAVRIYQLPNFNQPVSQKTFFKADNVQMLWNKLGTSLLCLAQTEVDKTGKSYYGETNLYLLGIAGSYDSKITLDKEGPIYDFSWSPSSREFGVVYGYMPAKTTIFDARGNEVHSLPLAPRNTIKFSPQGRLVLIGGFGNLQGAVDIYDRQDKFKKISSFQASNTSVSEWSPDGKYILTATTSPRLRVDNGVKIWHHSGELVYVQDYPELYQVTWRPQDVNQFPLRSLSPAPKPHESVAANVKIVKKTSDKPAGAYVPPHARNAGVTRNSTTSLYQLEIKNNIGAATTTNGGGAYVVGAAKTKVVPGAAPPKEELSKSAAKNKKKREAAKRAKEQEEEAAAAAAADAATAPTADAANTSPSGELNGPTGSSFEDKKIRSLLKKLRAIEDLKQRQINGDKLEDTQVQKITTEIQVRKELESYGWVETDE
ncbi:translation initiation factor eIF-2A [Nadsonia fulvescens var. elongata DSM 6958]|uniref:Eukaryotic translation initiation factor 2A n=1 Tax=Nadsonia fulvescens var. elongata DSM 6958 TaxID=857566 RepID=A0A1E3PPN8_9ASCO|nr:translation initiation factor eIF-2A [Nadsonia fulvescens var. elongata DSM 6958]